MKIDLRTDPRMTRAWAELSPLCEAIEEICDNESLQLENTKLMALLRCSSPGVSSQTLTHRAEKRVTLAWNIRDYGYNPNPAKPITVRLRGEDSLYIADGTGRACTLLVLGLPVEAELIEEPNTFNPLERYPLKE